MGCGGSTQAASDPNNNQGNQQKQQQQPKPVQNGVKRSIREETGSSRQIKPAARSSQPSQSQHLDNDHQRDIDPGPILTQEPSTEEVNVPKTEPGYPAPRPPKGKRDEIMQGNKMRKIDQHARNTPPEKADDFQTLISHLTSLCKSDVEKVRAIFIWLGNQSMDGAGAGRADIDTPNGFMKLISEQRASYASFFAVLCRHAGIPCVIIEGHAKSADYCTGDNEEKMKTLTNTWNAVYVADGWRPVFPLWACLAVTGHSSGAHTKLESRGQPVRDREVQSRGREVKILNEYFFLTDPEEMIHVAFPKDQRWQLVARPWTMQKFLDVPHCKQYYFMERLGVESKFAGTLKAREGTCSVQLACDKPSGMSVDYELYYNNEESGRDISASLQLSNYVMMVRTDSKWDIVIRFPEVGVYKLQLVGGRGYDTYLCEFKILVQEVHEDVMPYPLNPGPVGYGPSTDTEQAGIKALSHKSGIVKVTARNDVQMTFSLNKDIIVRTELFSDKMSKEELSKFVNQSQGDRSLTIVVRVPIHGEYALTMNAQPKHDGGGYQNVCNYLLTTDDGRKKRLRAYENPTEKNTRLQVQNMAKSHSTRDIEALEKQLTMFDKMALEDKGDYTAGHDALEYKKIKKELEDAVKRRHLETLEKAIEHGINCRFRDRVLRQIRDAEEVRDHLKHLNTISHDVMDMTQPTISELRSYKVPPKIVYDVMRSTFLLLGEKALWLDDWEDLQVLMGKTGKDGMLRRVKQFDTVNVKPEAKKNVDKTLKDHTENEARLASAGAGTFYVWLRDVSMAIGSGGGGGPVDTREQTQYSEAQSQSNRQV